MPKQNSADDSAAHNNGTITVHLTEKDHQTLLWAALNSAAQSMENAQEQVGGLRDMWPRTEPQITDTRAAINTLREDLDALDALGWPDAPRTSLREASNRLREEKER